MAIARSSCEVHAPDGSLSLSQGAYENVLYIDVKEGSPQQSSLTNQHTWSVLLDSLTLRRTSRLSMLPHPQTHARNQISNASQISRTVSQTLDGQSCHNVLTRQDRVPPKTLTVVRKERVPWLQDEEGTARRCTSRTSQIIIYDVLAPHPGECH